MPMSLKEEIGLLSMVDILGPLYEEEMENLAKMTPDTFLEQDDILYTPKEGTERLFILKKGRVQLYEVDEGGDEITLSVVEEGNVFGEMALTAQSLHGLYVRALTPSTVVSMRREEVERLITNKPEVGLLLIRGSIMRGVLYASRRRSTPVPALPPYLIEPIWQQFSALLPERETNHPPGCQRSRIPERVLFEKLVRVLVFGCAYSRGSPTHPARR